MNRSFDVQLQVALRALGEVVAPALSGSEKHVVEQLHLAMATLSFVKTRLPEARRYYRMELRSFMDLASDVAGLARSAQPVGAEELLASVAAGSTLLADPEADLADYDTATRDLRDGITRLSHLCVGAACHREIDRLILDRSEGIMLQSRQWCSPFGFELKPEELPAPAWRGKE